MSEVTREYPRFRSHKEVHAAKITAIVEPPTGVAKTVGARLVFGDIDSYRDVPAEFVKKNKPAVGGYWVLYDGPYESYSPAKAFEEGYTAIGTAAEGIRFLTDHDLPGRPDPLYIAVLDEPGPGGACHDYVIGSLGSAVRIPINFQKGPIAENGVNGGTQEVLLAIVIDRLRGFQSGKFACAANQTALEHVEAALTALKERTADRLMRNVEGTSNQ
jgi:hypothetical protein